MLRSLYIENVAVLRRVELEPCQGFSVLTGETGAGKSMIIDSINLLLGNRTSRSVLRTGAEKATVSAVFDALSPTVTKSLEEMGFSTDDGTLMLQRTLFADGRSQVRLNGQTITQGLQREIARMLISIHGQSDSQKLLQKASHGALLDAYAHPDEALAAYREVYHELKRIQKEIDSLVCDESEKLRLREILEYQIADINALKLKEGEEEALTRERDRLAYAERINERSELAYRALKGSDKSAYQLVKRAASALGGIDGLVEGVDELCARLDAVVDELADVAETALSFVDDDREDPTARIDRIEGRLDAISKLKRKYGGSIGAILNFRNEAQTRLDALEDADGRIKELEAALAKKTAEAESLAATLTELRRAAAMAVTREVTDALAFLDMPKVRFEIAVTPAPLSESGADDIEFLIATNVGEPLLPMIRIASGGELSRIMLALRSVLNDRDGAATVIFDEIDTGVSGKTARKVGIKLHRTAKHAQVLCVTHSAQIASLADTHYLITKRERDGRAETDVTLLSDDARVEEIARIMGGIEITNAQRDAAREMIAEYR